MRRLTTGGQEPAPGGGWRAATRQSFVCSAADDAYRARRRQLTDEMNETLRAEFGDHGRWVRLPWPKATMEA